MPSNFSDKDDRTPLQEENWRRNKQAPQQRISSSVEEQSGKVPVMTDRKDLASRLEDVGRLQEKSNAREGPLRQEAPLRDEGIVSDREPSITNEGACGAQVPGAAALAHEDATLDSLREGLETKISTLDEGLLREAESVGQSDDSRQDGGRQVDARLQQIKQKEEEQEWKNAVDLAHDEQPTSHHEAADKSPFQR